MENLREIVLDTLLTLEKEGGYSNLLVKDVLDKYNYLERSNKAFIKRVLEGTIERQIQLDFYLDGVSKTPVRKMKPLIRCLLRMSAYQLLFMDSVPDSAVCNEACKLADKRGFHTLKGFVNGVLRNLAKKKDALPVPDKGNTVKYYSVQYSMPACIVELFLSQYGEDLTQEILEDLLKVHEVSVRLSSGLDDKGRQELLDQFRAAGIEVKSQGYHDNLVSISNLESVAQLPGYEEGLFTIQDSSSALAIMAADIAKEDVVIDLCAAPGGKSMLAAETAKQVYAFDVSEGKCQRMEENMQRMGLTNVEVAVGDAREPEHKLFGKASVLLLDVPCSGLGIMGKKRDIKYHFQADKLQELYALQKEIVTAGINCLQENGVLVYSTCTINREENQNMTAYMLETLPLEPVSVVERIPEKLRIERENLQEKLKKAGKPCLKDHEMLFLPGTMETDGFFFAMFRRKESV